MSEPVRYLSTMAFDEEWLERLRVAVPELVVEQFTASSAAEIPDEVWAEVEVLHTSTVFPTVEQAPRLGWIQLDTSGVDHLRHEPVWQSAIPITTIGGVSPVPLAEYVIWAILGSAHRLGQMLQVQADRAWPDPADRWNRFLPQSVAGSTVVVVGYGRIGHEIGRLATAHGMNVIGVTRSGAVGRAQEQLLANFSPTGGGASAAPVTVVGPQLLAEVAADADYLVVVVPLTDQTRNLVDAEVIAALKPGAVMINVARGGIVDETALRSALRSRAVQYAVLDVFDDEPLEPGSDWWDEPNCFVTPHVSGLAPLYSDQVLHLVSQNLHRYSSGAPLLNLVDRARGY